MATYLEEEVREEGFARNLGNFARFMEAVSFSQGCVLNVAEVSRECSVERKVVEDYLTVLEDLLLAVRVPIFTKRAKRKLVAHPKFYYFDTGVYRALRPKGPLDSPEELDGAALETLVLQSLRAVIDNYKTGHSLYYWRTPLQQEVDFVLYGEAGLIAVEVKRAARLATAEFRGLKAFAQDYPSARLCMVYGGKTRGRDGSVELWPVSDFLAELPELLSGR